MLQYHNHGCPLSIPRAQPCAEHHLIQASANVLVHVLQMGKLRHRAFWKLTQETQVVSELLGFAPSSLVPTFALLTRTLHFQGPRQLYEPRKNLIPSLGLFRVIY